MDTPSSGIGFWIKYKLVDYFLMKISNIFHDIFIRDRSTLDRI